MTPGQADSLAPLEVASGVVLGVLPPHARYERLAPRGSPIAAMEAAILPALQRAPCLVSFSGGRDSSSVLAVAARVARREGLPLPIPATNRFPGVEASQESEWQELVVTHLGLQEWVRIEHGSELDCVGPIATRVLERHGLLWPFNAHFHVPLLDQARGGSLLTGIGGDEVVAGSAWPQPRDLLSRTAPRDALRVAFGLSPQALRKAVLRRRRLPLELPWLQPEALEAFRDAWTTDSSSVPIRWSDYLRWVPRLRYLQVGVRSLELLARDAGAAISHPFLDPAFLSALAGAPRSARFDDRVSGMRALFSEVLPDELLARETKSSFDGAFWHDGSRELVRSWAGEGVDEKYVDIDALKAIWASPEPDPRTFTLAQSVRLARGFPSRDRLKQAVHGV